MTLPQGVSKATGLHAALETLRLSPRNTLAIGDAENDHELLRLAEVGAAVEWGSARCGPRPTSCSSGNGPAAVADYLRAAGRPDSCRSPCERGGGCARLHGGRPRVLAGGPRPQRADRR